jgi:hypothetical protein
MEDTPSPATSSTSAPTLLKLKKELTPVHRALETNKRVGRRDKAKACMDEAKYAATL